MFRNVNKYGKKEYYCLGSIHFNSSLVHGSHVLVVTNNNYHQGGMLTDLPTSNPQTLQNFLTLNKKKVAETLNQKTLTTNRSIHGSVTLSFAFKSIYMHNSKKAGRW